MSGQKNRHRIFDVAIQKSNNLRRRISVFRTSSGKEIGLDFHPDEKESYITIGITKGTEEFFLEETYYLFLKSGECQISILSHVRSSTGWACHNFQTDKKYSAEDTLGSEYWPWLRMQLDVLVQWLEDLKTVRVNPYHPEIVLTEEEKDIDRYFSSTTKALDKYRIDLALTPLKLGINEVRESTISFD